MKWNIKNDLVNFNDLEICQGHGHVSNKQQKVLAITNCFLQNY